jgi:hypothetical protein
MIKRRLALVGQDRYRATFPKGDQALFTIEEYGVLGSETFQSHPWGVSWEGVSLESFAHKEEAVCFVIRFAYGIAPYHLIPSEILADFGLTYESGGWVDGWLHPSGMLGHEVVFKPGGVERPQDRKIRYQEWKKGRITDFPKREKPKNRLLRVMEGLRRRKGQTRRRLPELSDDECTFTLKSGSEAEKAYEGEKRRISDLRK